jgi:predicted O-methyltransferase YrrM
MSLIFCLKLNNRTDNKVSKKNISSIKYENSANLSYSLLKQKLLSNSNKNKKYLFDVIHFWSISNITYGTKLLFNILNISKYNEYYIDDDNIISNKLSGDNIKNNNIKNNINKNNIKNNNTFIIKQIKKIRDKVYSQNKINFNNLIVYFYNTIIKFIKSKLTTFNNSDNFIFSIYQFDLKNELIINLLYLLSLLFNEIVIVNNSLIICICYKEDNKYIEDIKKLDEKSYLFVDIKDGVDELKKYSINILNNKKKLLELCIKKDEVKLYKELYDLYSSYSHDPFIIAHDHDNLFHKYLQLHLIENSRRFFLKDKNESTEIKLHSAIKKEEGKNITKIIKKHKFRKCLEVGMAFGISASYILMANKNVNLMSIDPFQKDKDQWNSMGLKLLKEMGLDERHHYIGEKSYISLPKLLSTYGEEYFDFIFIDGWHTFDYTLIDFFYADKLLRIGGIILIDDALHKGVAKFVKYIDTNYDNYRKLEIHKTLAGYEKLANDTREWSFHGEF